jgi:hypothetical protein
MPSMPPHARQMSDPEDSLERTLETPPPRSASEATELGTNDAFYSRHGMASTCTPSNTKREQLVHIAQLHVGQSMGVLLALFYCPVLLSVTDGSSLFFLCSSSGGCSSSLSTLLVAFRSRSSTTASFPHPSYITTGPVAPVPYGLDYRETGWTALTSVGDVITNTTYLHPWVYEREARYSFPARC